MVAPVALAAAPGQYSAPEWLPFRHDVNGGGINVGCTYVSSDGLCAGHHGYWAIDFLTATGTPVYAAGAGIATNVTGSGFEGYGNAIVVDHGNHGTSLYAHLSEVLVGSGQWVDQNSMIGRVGSSGGANTPHLHYEESASTPIWLRRIPRSGPNEGVPGGRAGHLPPGVRFVHLEGHALGIRPRRQRWHRVRRSSVGSLMPLGPLWPMG